MVWKWYVMFGLGTLFGVCLAWLRFSILYRRIAAEFAKRRARVATPSKWAVVSERSTARMKIGVLPYDERPTLVHDSALLPDMVPSGPPEPCVRGSIEIDVDDVG